MSDADAGARIESWAKRFVDCLLCENAVEIRAGAEALFHDKCYWRDLVLFTWNIVTVEGCGNVAQALAETASRVAMKGGGCVLKAEPHFAPRVEEDSTVSGWLHINTRSARGVLHVRLRKHHNGSELCTLLFTCATELCGFEELAGPRRLIGQELESPVKRPRLEVAVKQSSPYVLIVGGSQSGLMLAARLRRLNVPTLVVDKHAKPGDGWRGRYSGLHLHDPVQVCDLPYMPFPDHFPVYMSKDQFGNWLDIYAQAMEIDFQGCTEVLKASYDSNFEEWTVQMKAQGTLSIIRAKHIVLATGNQSAAQLPSFTGMETFEGELMHSSKFPGCGCSDDKWRGKKCIVVGANTSAHDIAQDLCEHGAQVTMIQRSKTCVVKTQRIRELAASSGYSDAAVSDGKNAPIADMLGAALPYALKVPLLQEWVKDVKRNDETFYKSLTEVGWSQAWGDDETGPFMMFIRRFCGFYFDIGASQHIINGNIKLQSGETISEIKPRSVLLSSGAELECDLIVCATGYENMSRWVSKLISPEVAEAVGPCWGLGSGTRGDPGPYEGELRNMWKPTAQPGLWFQGGNIGLSRFYSLPLALQLKARYEKLPLKVYKPCLM